MGLFSWLGKMFGGSPPARPAMPPPLPSQRPGAPAAPPRPAPQAPQKKVRKLNLDPGQFAPLTGDQVKRRAFLQGGSIGALFRNPWFGRRDLIPPVSDDRTALIDRGMVGLGLLTPEQLVEIHEVGAQMEKLKPDLAQAHSIAEEAVKADAEERKRRKEQKQAEAAERKRRHAEDVARRKQTDIVFLGRGVSGGLADRRANVEKLQRSQLPMLAAPADLAQALSLTIPRLRWLAFHAESATVTHYVRFQVPKKSGGVRELSAPHRDLGAAQEWILINILEKLPTHNAAHGFVPGRSTMSNAVPHVARATVVNLDLKDFFPSITFPRVKGIFQELGYSPAVATILGLLCTECPRRIVEYAGKKYFVATGPRGLPQGACTSPALSNLLARRLDSRLSGLAKKLGFAYTRYADDLTFSGNGEAAAKVAYLLARVRHIAANESLVVNEKKTRVQRPGRRQTVTGIVVNKRPNVPRKVTKRLRAILHHARKDGLAAQNREQRDNFKNWLDGMIAYVQMVNPEKGSRLRQAFKTVAD
ncbi:MAG TPA: reverse transcriptase domain-containing protein [Verrucomicrobiae bacterium]